MGLKGPPGLGVCVCQWVSAVPLGPWGAKQMRRLAPMPLSLVWAGPWPEPPSQGIGVLL